MRRISAAPPAEPWPVDIQTDGMADEMFARPLDTEFAGEVRTLATETPKTLLEGMKGLACGPAVRAPVRPRPD